MGACCSHVEGDSVLLTKKDGELTTSDGATAGTASGRASKADAPASAPDSYAEALPPPPKRMTKQGTGVPHPVRGWSVDRASGGQVSSRRAPSRALSVESVGSEASVKSVKSPRRRWSAVRDAAAASRALALQDACQKGDTASVTQLLSAGADPNTVAARMSPPIVLAALGGHLGVVEALLEHGAEVNVADAMGGTALIAAAFGRHPAVVELLCTRGADVHRRTRDGAHAVAAAAITGDLPVLRTLLEHGGEDAVNALDSRKASPIMLAAQAGHVDVISLLVESGGDPDLLDGKSRSAKDYAVTAANTRRKKGQLTQAQADELIASIKGVLQTLGRTTTGFGSFASDASTPGSTSGKSAIKGGLKSIKRISAVPRAIPSLAPTASLAKGAAAPAPDAPRRP